MLKRIILLAIIVIPMSALAQKFGHINPLPIMQAMPEYTKAQTELQELQKQYEGEMKIMQDELAKKSSEYDKQRDSLPQNIRQRRESELQDLYARLQQYAQESNQNMQKATQEKMAEISKKIETAIQEGRRLHLHLRPDSRNPLHQRDAEHRRQRTSESQARTQISRRHANNHIQGTEATPLLRAFSFAPDRHSLPHPPPGLRICPLIL